MALIERDIVIRGDLAFAVTTDEGINERFDDGHIILLSDLLLICRVKTNEEMDNNPEGNESSFWLLFPPLAIRHVCAKDGTVDEHGKRASESASFHCRKGVCVFFFSHQCNLLPLDPSRSYGRAYNCQQGDSTGVDSG